MKSHLPPGMNLFPLLFFLCLSPLALVILFAVLLNTPYQGGEGGGHIVEVPEGASARRVIALLQGEGIIRYSLPARLYLALSMEENRIHSGEYKFEMPVTTARVIRQLLDGKVFLRQVTFPEGARGEEIIATLVEAGIGEPQSLREAFRDPGLIRDLGPGAVDLEGFLFPDTYRFSRSAPPEEIFGAMVRRFREVWDRVVQLECVAGEIDPLAAVTMASLIEKETGREEERAIISGVFHNRLRRGMLLQCDPTVIYGLLREGSYTGRLTRADLISSTPYNTYTNRGLPPGPIANPGERSIQAALCPGDSDYIYFVSMNTGRHHFSRTLVEHQAAVRRYQQ